MGFGPAKMLEGLESMVSLTEIVVEGLEAIAFGLEKMLFVPKSIIFGLSLDSFPHPALRADLSLRERRAWSK